MRKREEYFQMMLDRSVCYGDGTRVYEGNRDPHKDKEVNSLPKEGWSARNMGRYTLFFHPEHPEWEARVWEEEDLMTGEIACQGYFCRRYDPRKIRRRVEDALRKTATPEKILEIAGILGVRI